MKYYVEFNTDCWGCFDDILGPLVYDGTIKELYFGKDFTYYFIAEFDIPKEEFEKKCIDLLGDEEIVKKIVEISDGKYLDLKKQLKKF